MPICDSCLVSPRPLAATVYCSRCLTPFLDDFALDEHDLCAICQEGLVNFDSVYSFGRYEDSLRILIQQFKYNKVETLGQPLSRLLVRALPLDAVFDLVIPMPMHWRKHWQRGFNQAELLAKPVALHLGVPLVNNLKRSRYTKAQAGLGKEERDRNLQRSFMVDRPLALTQKRILLVDDVFTTGATLREAARALKEQGGAAWVCALTLARVSSSSDSGERPRRRKPHKMSLPAATEPGLSAVS